MYDVKYLLDGMLYTWYQSRNDVNGEQRAVWKFSHIQKDIIRTKRDGYSFAPKVFSSEKMQNPLQFGHRSRKF